MAPEGPGNFPPLRLVRDEQPSTRWSEAQDSVLSGSLLIGGISNCALGARRSAVMLESIVVASESNFLQVTADQRDLVLQR